MIVRFEENLPRGTFNSIKGQECTSVSHSLGNCTATFTFLTRAVPVTSPQLIAMPPNQERASESPMMNSAGLSGSRWPGYQ